MFQKKANESTNESNTNQPGMLNPILINQNQQGINLFKSLKTKI